jgi:hypothetical protein
MLSPESEPVESSRKPYPAINNRRRRVRQKVHLPAYANLAGGSSGMVLDLSEVIDLSEDGVCIQTSSPLKPDSTLTLSLDLMETKAFVSATGKVVWSDRRGRNGIHFPEISDISRQQLKQWLLANAASVGMDLPRNDPGNGEKASGVRAPTARREVKREFVRQSPEQTRAALAASTKEAEVSIPVDYSAVLSALVAVKREVEGTGTDVGKAVQLLTDRALSLTHATGAAFAIAKESGTNVMTCMARAGSDAPGIGARLRAGSGFSGECVRTGKVLRCDDAETDTRVDREGSRLLGIRSMIAAPIRRDDLVVGLLEVFSPDPHSFGPNDQKILERLAEMTAAAISQPFDLRSTQLPRDAPGMFEPGPPANSAAESGQSETDQPMESAASASPFRRLLLAALAIVILAALVWLIAPGAKDARIFGNPSHGPSDARGNTAKNLSAQAPETNDFDKLRKLATDGDPNAQFDMGARYATGEDVKQDYAESVRWFTLAAEQGHVIAQATLGAYYWAGRGIPQDLGKAYFWSLLAQAGGDEASRYRVSVLASRMPHSQVAAVQLQANDWLKAHQLSNGTSK